MACLVRNPGVNPLTLPTPYVGVLGGGESVVVPGTMATVVTAFGLNAEKVFDFVEVPDVQLLTSTTAGVRASSSSTAVVTAAAGQEQATILGVPTTLTGDAVVKLSAGSFDATVRGFTGSGTLTLLGAQAAAVPTSGVASGLAGAGSSSTACVKPTGAANWTASDSALLGRFVKVVSGGGAGSDPTNVPIFGAITAVTTTTITMTPITGFDATSRFELVDMTLSKPATQLLVQNNLAQVKLRGLAFTTADQVLLLSALKNQDIEIDACVFGVAASDVTGRLSKNANVVFKNCVMKAGADVSIERCGTVDADYNYGTAHAGFFVENCNSVDVKDMRAVGATGPAFSAIKCGTVRAEVTANTCTAVPVVLESLGHFEAWRGALQGTNAGAAHGVTMDVSGRYELVGSAITGAADFAINGNTGTWANMNNPAYGAYQGFGISAFGSGAASKAITSGNYLYEGNLDISGRLLPYGYVHLAAPLAAQTATGTNQATALDMSAVPALGGIELGTVAAGTGVRLPSNAAVSGVICYVVNNGAETLKVYPPLTGTLDGGASIDLTTGQSAWFCSLAGGLNFKTLSRF